MSAHTHRPTGSNSSSPAVANAEPQYAVPGSTMQADLEWARDRISRSPLFRKANGAGGAKKDEPKALPAAAESGTEHVAELELCADTETVDRTHLTWAELQEARVGHAFIKLRYLDPTKAPKKFPAPTQGLLTTPGGTAFGFWPLVYRPTFFDPVLAARAGHEDYQKDTEKRMAAGQTPGVGASPDPSHRGFKKNPFDSYVPGRVEEPDLAHEAKGALKYKLTQAQVDALVGYVSSKRSAQYSLYHYNCTTFAVEATRAAGQNAPSGGMFGVICLPNALYKQILAEKLGGNPDATTEKLGTTPYGDRETQPTSAKQ